MIKRVVGIILCISMLFAMVACSGGKGKSGNEKTGSESKPSESVTSDNNSSTDKTDDSTESDTGKVSYKTHPELWTTKTVALTFDDGPQQTNDKLLDILKEKGVSATFFMLGENMEKYPELVKRAIDEGHEIGWHSYNHSVSRVSNLKFVQDDFAKSDEVLDAIYPGYQIKFFRGPGGASAENILTAAKEKDWRVVTWTNYKFKDSATETISPEDRCSDMVFEGNNMIRNGEIILIHPRDNEDLLEGISILIDRLKEHEFKVTTVSELFRRRNGGTAGEVYTAPIY